MSENQEIKAIVDILDNPDYHNLNWEENHIRFDMKKWPHESRFTFQNFKTKDEVIIALKEYREGQKPFRKISELTVIEFTELMQTILKNT